MAGYAKQRASWQDFPTTSTPILAANLNGLEQAIFDLKRNAVLYARDYNVLPGNSTAANDAGFTSLLGDVPAYATGQGGTVIEFEPGIHDIATTVTAWNANRQGLTLRGRGSHTTFIRGSIVGPVVTNDNGGIRVYGRIEGLGIINTSTNAAARSIKTDQMSAFVARDTHFQSAATGASSYQAEFQNTFGLTLDAVDIAGSTGADACALFNSCTAVSLRGGSLQDSKSGLVATSVFGLSLSDRVIIENLAGSSPTYDGAITGSGVSGVWIGGNYSESCNTPFVQLYGNIGPNYGGFVGGNYVTNYKSVGVSLANLVDFEIAPNTFTPGANGVNAQGVAFGDSSTVNVVVMPQRLTSGSGASASLAGSTSAQAVGAAGIPTQASAATLGAPTANAETVIVSGTTNVTSVTAGYIGQKVTFIFQGILTFTDGSNLKLAGNFVTTADDTISLVCDGTNWFEVARSVN